MSQCVDIEIALRKLHELAQEEGDLGREYWASIGKLLERASDMQSRIDALCRELEQCRAQLHVKRSV